MYTLYTFNQVTEFAVPSLTPRDLAIIFCNMRNLHEISSEIVLAVAETLRDLPRINLARCLAIYAVFFPALCRYMCNFPQVCIIIFFSFSPFRALCRHMCNFPQVYIIFITTHNINTHA